MKRNIERMLIFNFIDDEDYEEDTGQKDLFLRCDQAFVDPEQALEALRPFGLNKAPNQGSQRTRLMLIAYAVAYASTGRWIAYSRNPKMYTGMNRYNGPDYNYRKIIAEIDKLKCKGLIEHDLVTPGSHNKKKPEQSAYRATQKLIEAMKYLDLQFVLHDPIRKRQLFNRKTGEVCYTKYPGQIYVSRLVPYEDDDITPGYRKNIRTINDYLQTIHLKWPGMEDRWIGDHHYFDTDAVLRTRLFVTRVFSRGSFEIYGRVHGFWQNVDKTLRPNILLNGEQTCEPDYSQCHLNLAYLSIGLEPTEDGYNIQGFDPKRIKRAVSILFNASSEGSARAALAAKFAVEDHEAQAMIDAVKEKHAEIADLFHDDLGVKFMFIESCILVEAMKMLVREDIDFLPIHDGLRVPVSKRDRTIQIMQEAFKVEYPEFTAPVKG
jgi:hypothetical protein